MSDKINSLDRFRKQSPKLVLESHSHCEVPAGCGGVVLRWRNPLAALSLLVNFYALGKATLFLDGREVKQIGNDVAPGPHVFALEVTDADLSAGLLMFAAVQDRRAAKETPAGVAEATLRVVSEADGNWRAATDDDSHDWTDFAFDDSHWTPLTRFVESPTPDYSQPGGFRIARCNEHAAAFLALRPGLSGSATVRVRRRFVVPAATVTSQA